MLDVHPPHHAANTWRDFFIHIATISVGLLIAIGLEQTVEAIHQHHQRVELEHDLHAETEKNIRLYQLDYAFFDAKTARLTVLRRYVEALRRKEPEATLHKIQVPPDPINDIFWVPVSSSWETAKESSLLDLLPRDEAAMFHDLYFQNDFVREYAERYFQTEALQRRFETRFQNPTTAAPATAEALEPMNADDLKQYSGLIADSLDSLAECRFLADLARSGAVAVLDGAESSDDVERAVGKAQHIGNAPTPAAK